jgi:hypothetical protein
MIRDMLINNEDNLMNNLEVVEKKFEFRYYHRFNLRGVLI